MQTTSTPCPTPSTTTSISIIIASVLAGLALLGCAFLFVRLRQAEARLATATKGQLREQDVREIVATAASRHQATHGAITREELAATQRTFHTSVQKIAQALEDHIAATSHFNPPQQAAAGDDEQGEEEDDITMPLPPASAAHMRAPVASPPSVPTPMSPVKRLRRASTRTTVVASQ